MHFAQRRAAKVRKHARRKRARERPCRFRTVAFGCRWAGETRLCVARRNRGLHRLRRRLCGCIAIVTPVVVPAGGPRMASQTSTNCHFGGSGRELCDVSRCTGTGLDFSSFGFVSSCNERVDAVEEEGEHHSCELSAATHLENSLGSQVGSAAFGGASGRGEGLEGKPRRDSSGSGHGLLVVSDSADTNLSLPSCCSPCEGHVDASVDARETHGCELSVTVHRSGNHLGSAASGCGEGPDGNPGHKAGSACDIKCTGLVRVRDTLLRHSEVPRAPRGGGKSNHDFLRALRQLVEEFSPQTEDRPAKGKGSSQPATTGKGNPKGKGGPSKGKGPSSGAHGDPKASGVGREPNDDQLLAAIGRLVQRATVNGSQGLGDRIRQVLSSAETGKQLTSGRAERRRKAKARKAGGGQLQSFYSALPQRQPRSASRERKAHVHTGWQVDKSMPAITAGEAKRRMQEQLPLQAERILVKNPDQATELMDMARVNEVKGKVALLCQGELGEEAKKCDVTCIKGDRREVKQWQAVALTREGCPEPPLVRRQSSFKPPARKLQTLRVLAAKTFMHADMWQTMQDSPKEVVNRLLGLRAHKAEGWKLVTGHGQGSDPYFVGYVTFEADGAAKALAQSGQNGIFTEPLARDQAARPLVSWIAPGDLVGIAYLRCALQEAAGKPLALRKGQGACLGVRAQKGEAIKSTSTWRVRGVPRSWSDTDVIDALQGASFTEVKILGEAQGSRPWLVRGELPDDTGDLAMLVEAGDKVLRIERVLGRQKAESFREKRWQPPRASKSAPPVRPATVDNMVIDDDDDDEEEQAVEAGPVSAGAPAQAPASGEADTGDGAGSHAKPTPQPKRQRVGAWDELECGASGHCFYNCVTAGFVMKTTRTSFEEIKGDLMAKGRGLRAALPCVSSSCVRAPLVIITCTGAVCRVLGAAVVMHRFLGRDLLRSTSLRRVCPFRSGLSCRLTFGLRCRPLPTASFGRSRSGAGSMLKPSSPCVRPLRLVVPCSAILRVGGPRVQASRFRFKPLGHVAPWTVNRVN